MGHRLLPQAVPPSVRRGSVKDPFDEQEAWVMDAVFLLVLTAILLLAFFARPAKAQQMLADTAGQPIGTVAIYPMVVDSARATLERAWDETNPMQPERGYCVTKYKEMQGPAEGGIPGFNVWIEVTEVAPAPPGFSDQRHASIVCPSGQPTLHTHPPATCDLGQQHCVIGGPGAYECAPSRQDLMTLISLGDDWGIIQCDRHAFRFFYPFELRLLSQSDTSRK